MIRRVTENNWQKALNDFLVNYASMHAMCPHPFVGIIDLIKVLRNKSIIVALVTGKGEGSCSITLEKFNMKDCFDCIETGSPYENRKSEAIDSLLKKYRLQPNEALYIGDTVSDVLACKQIEIECLSAAWSRDANIEKLKEINAGNVIKSIPELKERLQTYL
jgi:phosphoglycolate phosphatase